MFKKNKKNDKQGIPMYEGMQRKNPLTKIDRYYLKYREFMCDQVYQSFWLTLLSLYVKANVLVITWAISAYLFGLEHSLDIISVAIYLYIWEALGCRRRLKKFNSIAFAGQNPWR